MTFTSSVLHPHERGLELGERFRSEIGTTVAAYRRLLAARASGPFDVDLWAERAWDTIGRVAPGHADEIAGIADGAGRPVREVAAINARTELLVAANPTGVTECSSVVSVPPGGAPFAVQTWDWYDAMSDGWFHWRYEQPDGRVVETMTEYGMLAKIGVNSDGVGVMLNMLHHANDAARVAEGSVGYPVHLLSRRILDEATSFDDAVKIVAGADVGVDLTHCARPHRRGCHFRAVPGRTRPTRHPRRAAGAHEQLRLPGGPRRLSRRDDQRVERHPAGQAREGVRRRTAGDPAGGAGGDDRPRATG